jgi:hypothetical protein
MPAHVQGKDLYVDTYLYLYVVSLICRCVFDKLGRAAAGEILRHTGLEAAPRVVK